MCRGALALSIAAVSLWIVAVSIGLFHSFGPRLGPLDCSLQFLIIGATVAVVGGCSHIHIHNVSASAVLLLLSLLQPFSLLIVAVSVVAV